MSTYDDLIMSYTPLLYWLMKETSGTTAADASGNGRTGVYTDTYTLNQTDSPITVDATARSVLFDGSDAYVLASYNPFSGSKTFGMWGKRTDTSGPHALFGGGNPTGTPMLQLASGSQQIGWGPDSANTFIHFDNNWPNDAAWHFAMLTFNNSTFDTILYIDGVKNGATKNVGNGYGSTPGGFQVSGRGTFQDVWKGKIANPFVINGLLVASDALAIYNAATTAPPPPVSPAQWWTVS